MSETTANDVITSGATPDFFREDVTTNECVTCGENEATRVNVDDKSDAVCGTCFREIPRVDRGDYIFISDVPKRPADNSKTFAVYIEPGADYAWGILGIDGSGEIVEIAPISWVNGALPSINDFAAEVSSVFNVAASSAEDDGYERLMNGMRTYVRPNGNDGELLRVSIIVDKLEKITRAQAEEWIVENDM